jgi:SAM-dependent methyltransferase
MLTTAAACLNCHGPMTTWLDMPIDAKKDATTPFSSVRRCTQCGLGSLSPLPAADDVPGFYELDAYYTHGASHIAAHPSTIADKILTKLAWWADRSRPFDVAAIAATLPKGAGICDLGCGDAQYLRDFKARGFEVIGVEPDAISRDRANAAGVPVITGSAEDPGISGAYDLVIMTHVLEHCRDPRRAIGNAFALTKPGGRCYIEVPNCAAEHFRTFTICSEMFDAPRHIHFFTPQSLAELARSVGFSIRERLFSGYVRDFSPSWRAWEREIADRVRRVDPSVETIRHDLAASIGLFLRSFWRAADRKYDCVGLMLERHAL